MSQRSKKCPVKKHLEPQVPGKFGVCCLGLRSGQTGEGRGRQWAFRGSRPPGAVNTKQRTGDFHVATSLSPPVAFLLLKKEKALS